MAEVGIMLVNSCRLPKNVYMNLVEVRALSRTRNEVKPINSLFQVGYTGTGVLPLHTPDMPREDTKQLVEDASW